MWEPRRLLLLFAGSILLILNDQRTGSYDDRTERLQIGYTHYVFPPPHMIRGTEPLFHMEMAAYRCLQR